MITATLLRGKTPGGCFILSQVYFDNRQYKNANKIVLTSKPYFFKRKENYIFLIHYIIFLIRMKKNWTRRKKAGFKNI